MRGKATMKMSPLRRSGMAYMLRAPVLALALLAGMLVAIPARMAEAQDQTNLVNDLFAPMRTDSPRDTLESFIAVSATLEDKVREYNEDPSYDTLAEISILSDLLVYLIDLDNVAVASRRDTGIKTFEYLMDIFGRIGTPDASALPGVDDLGRQSADSFRIPRTPLRIEHIEEGPREGEFLFSEATVRVAPRYYAAVRHLPLQSKIDMESWVDFAPQQTGPLVPQFLVQLIPDSLKRQWMQTPAWKVIFLFLLLASLGGLLVGLRRLLRRIRPDRRVIQLLFSACPPLVLIYLSVNVLPLVGQQVHLSGQFALVYSSILSIAIYTSFAMLFWLAARLCVEAFTGLPRVPAEGLDADLIRLTSGSIGLIGSLVILAMGAQAIGLPVLSVVAGLGIGGLAVALAVRPTIENLIGGVILYADRPVKVGDFCSVGDQRGTVASIGIRSTKLRALDRTLISIPNAQFADMQIINWAECDQMLIGETIVLRNDTTTDQLRYLLVQLRRMLHAHPRIDGETVRVRLTGLSQSSLSVNIRVYAETREWNDFFAIREDVFLRVMDIIRESGTNLAFPSQTLYMARDAGRDPARSDEAEDAVRQWRETDALPFPRLSAADIDGLDDTLDYPPAGSPDANARGMPTRKHAEPLSAPEDPAEGSTARGKAGTT